MLDENQDGRAELITFEVEFDPDPLAEGSFEAESCTLILYSYFGLRVRLPPTEARTAAPDDLPHPDELQPALSAVLSQHRRRAGPRTEGGADSDGGYEVDLQLDSHAGAVPLQPRGPVRGCVGV